LLAFAGGCQHEPLTEVMVIVRSDLTAGQLGSAKLVVEVGGAVQAATPCAPVTGAGGFPLSIGLIPNGSTKGSFTVRATGYADGACSQFTAEQSATIQFVTGHTLELDLNLLAACVGRMCMPGTTCYDGSGCSSDNRGGLPEFSPQGSSPDLSHNDDLSTVDSATLADMASPVDGLPDLSTPSTCLSPSSPGQLCEGFESGMVNPGIWGGTLQNATTTVETTQVDRGSKALHIGLQAVTAGTSVHGQIEESSATGMGGHFFVRAFFYVASPLPTSSLILSSIFTSGVSIDIGPTAAGYFHANSTGAMEQFSSTATPLDQWFCMEYEVDGTAGTLNAWLDDSTLILNQTGITPATFTGIGLGASMYGPATAQSAHDVWVDEIIVDKQRVGCAK
jgi:hypothetical protein